LERILQFRNVAKTFPGVKALQEINLDLYSGEVHVVIGENGAGKSTLMKILSGAYQPDEGEIYLGSTKVKIKTPKIAENLGIQMIYQEFNLIAELTVTKNIMLGHEIYRSDLPFIFDHEEMKTKVKAILEELKLDIDPNIAVKKLGVGKQQMVEIAKALLKEARILILDEPTSSLSDKEIEELFRIIKLLKEKGVGIFYISHRLEELFKIGDRVTVMRDGKIIDTQPVTSISMNQLIEKIAGRVIDKLYPHTPKKCEKVLLEVAELNSEVFKAVNLKVYQGEIVGLAGLVGAGRSELVRAIFGVDPYQHGEVFLEGVRVPAGNPQKSIQMGLSLLPEDRKSEGLTLIKDVRENVTLAALEYQNPTHIINKKKEKDTVWGFVKSLSIATPSLEKLVRFLSGGTQQKVVLAKWLLTKAKVFIFDEPTRGIDVGAKNEVYGLMEQLVAAGAGILMVSSDLPEVLGMSDRIYIMAQGRISGEVEAAKTNQTELLNLAFGQSIRR
jgi:ribose transport system ATP-binding protein